MLERLPQFMLTAEGPASRLLRARGLADYRAAAAWVQRLPYGRGRGRDDLAIVEEGRGTCSSKHALLARVAREHAVEVALVLGIYMMDGGNTPGVGEVLQRYGLRAIPEAHCVLRWNERYVDLTRPGAGEPVFMFEEVIAPEEVVAHKVEVHRGYLARWLADELPGWTLDELWRAREDCIAAL